jgi:hypothetical protein
MKTFQEYLIEGEEDINPHDGFRSLPKRSSLLKLLTYLDKNKVINLDIYIHWTHIDDSSFKSKTSVFTISSSNRTAKMGTPWSVLFIDKFSNKVPSNFMSTLDLIKFLKSKNILDLIEDDFPTEATVSYDYDNSNRKTRIKITSI